MKKLFLSLGIVALFASCTVSRDYQITGEPIGTKTGVAKSKIFGDSDYSINKAAKKGKITVIGAVEVTQKMYLIFPVITTRVYGE